MNLDFTKLDGLLPAVIQDHASGRVLMVGFMNEEAFRKTVETGFATFYSRSRKKLWMKGESSGHRLVVKEISVAAKLGGPDPAANARLFAALEKARKASVTRDVIERAQAILHQLEFGRTPHAQGGDGLITVRYEYDVAGRLTALIDDNGNETDWQYDSQGRKISETKGSEAGPVRSGDHEAAARSIAADCRHARACKPSTVWWYVRPVGA